MITYGQNHSNFGLLLKFHPFVSFPFLIEKLEKRKILIFFNLLNILALFVFRKDLFLYRDHLFRLNFFMWQCNQNSSTCLMIFELYFIAY